jgi:tetratricopeptide (TPR) repeat protein
MKSANVALFANIFTIDHAEEILRDYPVRKSNVPSLNNIAYYLEQMSITMPAIAILETVLDSFPDRDVAYLNLYDALTKMKLKTKAEKLYKQYLKLMNSKKLSVKKQD